MRDFEEITIIPSSIYNPTDYAFIGHGVHGAVFKLSEDTCVKIYADEKYRVLEEEAYKKLKGFSCAPDIYEVGSKYIIMEYIDGDILNHYLATNSISMSISIKLLAILEELIEYGAKFIDIELNNTIIKEDGSIKIIDVINVFQNESKIPVYLLNSLAKYKQHLIFMEHVKILDRTKYDNWVRFIDIFPI